MSKTPTAFDKSGTTSAASSWAPPEDDSYTVPLNLMAELAKVGVGPDDRIIIERLPEGAALTIGEGKPDGSWILLPNQLAVAEYIPLSHNGRTYELALCVLTADPNDHGMPKTKARRRISVKVPLAKLPSLESLLAATESDDAVPEPAPIASAPSADARVMTLPSPEPAAASDTIIHLPADPRLKVAPHPGPLALAAPTPETAAIEAPAQQPQSPARAPVDIDRHFAAHAAEWQSHLREALRTAEQRLKASQLEQLARIQAALSREETARVTAIEANWKAELERRAEAAETRLQAGAGDRGEWEAEMATRLATAEAAWRAETAAERAATETRLRQEYERRLAEAQSAPAAASADDLEAFQSEIEGRMAALHDMRLAAAETSWRQAESRRLAIAEATWAKGEAERMSAAEARWRAEHDKKLEAVLANVGLLVRGQLGDIDRSAPLPAVAPAAAPARPPLAVPVPEAPPTVGGSDTASPAAASPWRDIAAA